MIKTGHSRTPHNFVQSKTPVGFVPRSRSPGLQSALEPIEEVEVGPDDAGQPREAGLRLPAISEMRHVTPKKTPVRKSPAAN